MNKKALILEGGGMRGIFTAGVLDYFLDKNIEFDYIIGVSAGCANALNYISKQKGRSLYTHTTLLDNHSYIGFKSLAKTGEFIDSDFLYTKVLYEIYPYDFNAFMQNNCKFEAVVTNALTGEACYMSKPTSQERLMQYSKAIRNS